MSNSIEISKLTIAPNRQRREFEPEALTDLANSILAHGLLHPIVVRETAIGLVLERQFLGHHVARRHHLGEFLDIGAGAERLGSSARNNHAAASRLRAAGYS